MKKLIYLTGEIDSPFLTNEIGAYVKTFDKVFVIVYGGDRKACDRISKKYGFEYAFISDKKTYTVLFDLLKWRNKSYVKAEFKKIGLFSSLKLKRRVYAYYYGLYWTKLRRIVKDFINEKDDYYVYSFWLSRPAFGVANIMSSYSNVRRAVSRTHRYDLYEEENGYNYLPFRKYISENVDTIYFSSKDTVDYFYNKRYSEKKLPKCKLSYLGTFDHGQKESSDTKDILTIASCSYIIQRKRLDLIILLIKKISEYYKGVRWIHIGDGEISNKIKDMANKELAGVEYHFLGSKSDEEIFELYRSYDVDFFVNLSDSEGIPVSIMEAMSMGIPIIARNVGGISDAVSDNNGIIINSIENVDRVIEQVAQRTVDIFLDKKEYKKVSDNSYAKWNDTFNGDKNAIRVASDIINDSVIPFYDYK